MYQSGRHVFSVTLLASIVGPLKLNNHKCIAAHEFQLWIEENEGGFVLL